MRGDERHQLLVREGVALVERAARRAGEPDGEGYEFVVVLVCSVSVLSAIRTEDLLDDRLPLGAYRPGDNDLVPHVDEQYTVGEHVAVKWPYATEPRRFTVTGRSVAPQLDQPSMVWLRLRAMFGLGARAEILRHVLVLDDDQSSIAAISAATSYTKRNVAEECETLEQAGVLRVRTVGNRFHYSLAKRTELEAFVGTMPAYRPNWTAMLNVAGQLVDLEAATVTSSSRTRSVHARKAIDAIAGDLDELRIELPGSHVAGPELWTEIQRLGAQTLGKWSLGEWHHPA